MKKNVLEILNQIAQAIYDKKGANILALEVAKLPCMADYLVIAEGHVDRHVMSIAHAVIEELGKIGKKPIHVEGLRTGDWIVVDYSDVVIHLFQPGLREKYALEKLWNRADIVDLDISIAK